MTSTEPNIPDTGRYAIGQVAKILNVHRETVLEYTKTKGLKFGVSKINNRKFFTGFELKKFWRSQW